MKAMAILLGGAALALSSTLALATGPEDLLPPAFRDPPPRPSTAPTPTPAPSASPSGPRPTVPPAAAGGSGAVVQPLPGDGGDRPASSASGSGFSLPEGFPSLDELENMEEDEVNALLGLRPEFDIPAAARRATRNIGILSAAEGGFASGSLSGQPAALVRAALVANDGPLVSRWGHILLRRVLASRMNAPQGMSPVEFAALRAGALNAMGEGAVARSLVQDVDGDNYDRALTNAAFDAYLATGDILGMCPVARLQGDLRDDGEWQLLRAICAAYSGEGRSAERDLDRALGTGLAPAIDVRLAQRYAGAAGDGGRALNIEWDGVEELTPWRFALSRALGVDLPEALREGASAGRRYDIADTLNPAVPLIERISASDEAGARGVLSSAAMVDLYSQLWASDTYQDGDRQLSGPLREAYVASNPADRLAAMRALWNADAGYGRTVLTAYAAARLPVSEDYVADAPGLIASMLAAGLDRNAMRWGNVVPAGSQGWALLVLAQETRNEPVSGGDVDTFVDDDDSAEQRRSGFLIAGLAALDRIESDDLADYADQLNLDLARESAWSAKINRAAQLDNQALVALLAGVGMRGTDWSMMTPRHLYHIVRSLNAVGLSAEARMIAAEAVARG